MTVTVWIWILISQESYAKRFLSNLLSFSLDGEAYGTLKTVCDYHISKPSKFVQKLQKHSSSSARRNFNSRLLRVFKNAVLCVLHIILKSSNTTRPYFF